MKPAERIAIIYGVSVAAAAAVSFARGRRGADLLMDTALHGAIAGTAFNVVGWLVLESGVKVPLLAARSNPKDHGVGKLGEEGKKLLARLNTDDLYAESKEDGVKIAAIPEDPSVVKQDED